MNKTMAGTEKTFEYVVVAEGKMGRIGFRNLSDGFARVRIEPFTSNFALLRSFEEILNDTFEAEWKVPGEDGQNRFSTVVDNKEALDAAVAAGLRVIEPITEVNEDAPKSMQKAAGVDVKSDVSAEIETLKAALTALLKAL